MKIIKESKLPRAYIIFISLVVLILILIVIAIQNGELDYLSGVVNQQKIEDEIIEEYEEVEEPIEKIDKDKDKELRLIKYQIKRVQYKLPDKVVDIITNSVYKYSKKFDVPYIIILATIEVESHFNIIATSTANAIGLMQVLYSFWKTTDEFKTKFPDMVNKEYLYNIDTNIHAGTYILKLDYDRTGTWPGAIKAYYGHKVEAKNKLYLNKIMSAIGRWNVDILTKEFSSKKSNK